MNILSPICLAWKWRKDGRRFGTLKDVIQTGANDVYVIDSLEHGEVLVPAIKECILEVDIPKGRMKIRVIDD